MLISEHITSKVTYVTSNSHFVFQPTALQSSVYVSRYFNMKNT